jgi:hypothetical protein
MLCHHPRIRSGTPKGEAFLPSVFVVRVGVSKVEAKDGTCLVSTNEDSPTLDITFAWMGLVLMTKEACMFFVEVFKEFYLFHHRFVCKSTPENLV